MGLDEVKGALRPMLEELLHKEFEAVRIIWGLQLQEEMQKWASRRKDKRSGSTNSGVVNAPLSRRNSGSGPGGLIAGAGASANAASGACDNTISSDPDASKRDLPPIVKPRFSAAWMVKSFTCEDHVGTNPMSSARGGSAPSNDVPSQGHLRVASKGPSRDGALHGAGDSANGELPPRPAAPIPPDAAASVRSSPWSSDVAKEQPPKGSRSGPATTRGQPSVQSGSSMSTLDKPESRSSSKEDGQGAQCAARPSAGSVVAGRSSTESADGKILLPHMSVTGSCVSSREQTPLASTMPSAEAGHRSMRWRQVSNEWSLEILPHDLKQEAEGVASEPRSLGRNFSPTVEEAPHVPHPSICGSGGPSRRPSSDSRVSSIRGQIAASLSAARDVMARGITDNSAAKPPLKGHIVDVVPSGEMNTSAVSGVSSQSSEEIGFDPALMRLSTSVQPMGRSKFLGKARKASIHHLLKTSEEYWHAGGVEDIPVSKRLTFRQTATNLVRSSNFDYCVCCLIILNAISIGAQTNHVAIHQSYQVPAAMRALETAFCALFASELMLRLYVHRASFFCTGSWQWNLFDTAVVGVQVMEEVLAYMSPGADGSSEGVLPQNLSFTRMLRILRLVRVIRLVRVLRLIRELRMLVSSISNSLKSLGWTVLLLILLIYTVALYLTQLVSDHTIDNTAYDDSLRVYYGSVGRTMLSLFESITGGLDWDSLVSPLTTDISPYLAFFFSWFIAFSVLAMLNVVTGVFVESVLLSARADKDQFLVNNVREIFQTVDGGIKEGCMNLDQFLQKLHTPQMQEFLKGIDVDPSDAKGLFRLLDVDDSGVVEADEFLSGCLRLRGPAKALDAALIIQEVRGLQRSLECDHFGDHSPSKEQNDVPPARYPTMDEMTVEGTGISAVRKTFEDLDTLEAVEEVMEGSVSPSSSPKTAWLTPTSPTRGGRSPRLPQAGKLPEVVASSVRHMVKKVTPDLPHRPLFSGKDVPIEMGSEYPLEPR